MDELKLVKIAELELEPSSWAYNEWKVPQAIADGLFEAVSVEVFAGASIVLFKYECGVLGLRGVLARPFAVDKLNITEYDLSEDYELRKKRIEIMESYGDEYVSEKGFANRAKVQADKDAAAMLEQSAAANDENTEVEPSAAEDELPF